jgi:predicted nucleic acid-binding protein
VGLLIDSDILIEIEKGRIDLKKFISGREEEEFFISAITASELLHGVFRAEKSDVHARRSAFVESILATFPILEIDLKIARIHSEIYSEMGKKNRVIGVHDSWIAASCLAYGLVLISKNIKDFKKVPGLKFELWPQK